MFLMEHELGFIRFLKMKKVTRFLKKVLMTATVGMLARPGAVKMKSGSAVVKKVKWCSLVALTRKEHFLRESLNCEHRLILKN